MAQKEISKAVLKRLPTYLSYLKSMPDNGQTHISATALASALNMGEVQVRKDLALVSNGGRPKVGYPKNVLIDDIETFLGYSNINDAVLIGAGKLGLALLGYSGFAEYGLNEDLIESYTLQTPENGETAHEFFIAKVKEGKMAEVEAALEKRKEAIAAQWGEGVGADMDYARQPVILKSGNYIMLAVHEDIDEVRAEFERLTKAE